MAVTQETEALLTVAEAAKLARWSKPHLWRFVQRGEIEALRIGEGHGPIRIPETTLIYLRRKDTAKAMESVRDLSWGVSVPSSQALEAHTGFEPVPPP
jgi:excisionase family DNA binding protein